MSKNVSFSLRQFSKFGLNYLNYRFETTIDIFIQFTKHCLIIAIFLATVMMIVGEGGILYSSMRLPLWQIFMVIAEDPSLPIRLHPEQGIHWSTLLIYGFAFLWLLTNLPKRGIHGFHCLAYSLCAIMAMFVVPFEWIYTSLVDFFHNVPVEGTWSITLFGLWKPPYAWVSDSVIGRNGFMAVAGILGLYILGKDAMENSVNFKKFKLNFNKKFILLTILFALVMTGWVVLPVFGFENKAQSNFYNGTLYVAETWTGDDEWYFDYSPQASRVEGSLDKGSTWFPQCVYVWYEDPPWNSEEKYDIVHEEWHPNDTVKFFNTLSKFLSVIMMTYLFIPKRQEEIFKCQE